MTDIRAARRRLGMSQSELATRLGLHQTTISRFETGDMPVDERTALALTALEHAAAASLLATPIEQKEGA